MAGFVERGTSAKSTRAEMSAVGTERGDFLSTEVQHVYVRNESERLFVEMSLLKGPSKTVDSSLRPCKGGGDLSTVEMQPFAGGGFTKRIVLPGSKKFLRQVDGHSSS